LERIIFFGEPSLRRATISYLAHYHGERNHQGLENKIIQPGNEVGRHEGDVQCRERLGGLLRYYYREAAQQLAGPGALRLAGRLGIWPTPLAFDPLTAALIAMFGRDSGARMTGIPGFQRVCASLNAGLKVQR